MIDLTTNYFVNESYDFDQTLYLFTKILLSSDDLFIKKKTLDAYFLRTSHVKSVSYTLTVIIFNCFKK